jgi:hypothetical protein
MILHTHMDRTADGRLEWQVRLEMEQNLVAWRKRKQAVVRMRRIRAWRAEQAEKRCALV